MFYYVPNVLVTKLEIRVSPITEEKTKVVLKYSKTSLSEMATKFQKNLQKKNTIL